MTVTRKDYGPGVPGDPFPEYATPDDVADIAGSTGSISDAVDTHDADVAAHDAAGFASDTDISDAVDVHEAASDPHAAYTKQAEVDSSITDHDDTVDAHAAAGYATATYVDDSLTVHSTEDDPHTMYMTSAEVDTSIGTHTADTTSVHGITDTSALTTATSLATGISTHAGAADPHGDRAYADGVASGLDIKDSVKAATTANITLSGAQTIDGVSVVALDRVLVKNQSTTKNNGIYIAAAGAWARATDADSSGEVTAGLFTYVEQGTTNGTSSWVCNSAGTLDTDPVLFTQFNSAGTVTAGAGLLKSGSTIDLVSGGGLTVAADSVTVASNHGGSTHATATSNATSVSFPVVRPATGNTSDDTASVQAAIDALPSTGGTLALDPGTVYTLTATTRTVTAASRTTSGSDTVHVFTYSGGNSAFAAGDVVTVRGTTVSSGTDNWNSTYLIKSQTATTITCYANNQVAPGTWASGGSIVGAGVYIRDKGGVVVQGASARTQGAASGSWFKSGTTGMVMVVSQKLNDTVSTHSGPEFKNVGFIDTAVDANVQTSVPVTWAAGVLTFTKASHGFTTGDSVWVFNSGAGGTSPIDGVYTVLSSGLTSSVFKVALVADPGSGDATTCSVAYETLPTANAPDSVGLVIAGQTRWYAERCHFGGLEKGLLLMTHGSKDTSWGKMHACVWQQCKTGFKILGDGGQSVYIDGGNLIMHTGQKGFVGPNPEETNDANHFRCTGLKFDTQYTDAAGCMGFDLGKAQYCYIGHNSFEMEGTSTTRGIKLGGTGQCHGTLVGNHFQHNGTTVAGRASTAIELVGTSAANAASVTVVGGHYTNLAEGIHIGPYAQGCTVLGGDVSSAGTPCSGVVIDNSGNVLGTTIIGFSSTRASSSASIKLLDIPSGSDTTWKGCWDYVAGTPHVYEDGKILTKAGAPSNTAGSEFPQFASGQMLFDTTNNKLYVRNQTGTPAWKSVTVT